MVCKWTSPPTRKRSVFNMAPTDHLALKYEKARESYAQIEKRFEKSSEVLLTRFDALSRPQPSDFLMMPQLCLELEKVLGVRTDYSLRTQLRKIAGFHKAVPWNNLVLALGGLAIYVTAGLIVAIVVSYFMIFLLTAPIRTLLFAAAVVLTWRYTVNRLQKRDDDFWRNSALASLTHLTALTVERKESGEWVTLRQDGQESPRSHVQKFNLGPIEEGLSVMDVFARSGQTFVGTITSMGLFYPPGQFDYPISIPLPDPIVSYFKGMSDLMEPFRQMLGEADEAVIVEQQLKEISTLYNAWKDIHIPDPARKRILQMLALFQNHDPAAPRGLLLFGPPGTGKTLVAKAIADSCGVPFHATSLPDFKMGYTGQSAQKVKQFWTDVREKGHAIIFVDECEGVFGARGGTDSDSFTAEIVQSFLAEWDGLNTKGKAPDIWVIGATNRRELIDAAILSRFGQEIEIPLPDGAMRKQIIEAELNAINLPTEWLPDNIGKRTQGLSGRDLNRLATAIRMAMMGEDTPSLEHLTIALAQMRKRGATAADEEARWDTLVLDERTMKELKTVCGMLNHADALRKQGVTIPRGIIFHGPPGTGKTQIARTLANESGLNFIAATTSDMKANFLGQSGNKVKELFARTRSQSPAILFIDEIDIVCPMRGGAPDPLSQEIIGQILQELDGVKAIAEHVFVVAATNRLDSIDSAVLSRFPKRVEVPLPDLAGRKQLLSVLLRKLNHTLSEEQITRMAENSEGKSGRDLRSMVENAQNNAVSRALESGEPHHVQMTPEDFL